MNKKRKTPKKLVCLCNSITEEEVIGAIKSGATSLGEIFDTTMAGVGACGGSCRPELKKLIEEHQKKNQER